MESEFDVWTWSLRTWGPELGIDVWSLSRQSTYYEDSRRTTSYYYENSRRAAERALWLVLQHGSQRGWVMSSRMTTS